MSTQAEAILMFGLYFEDKDEAMSFMRENGYPEIMELYDEPEEDDKEGLVLVNLNPYSGRDYLLGFELKPGETLDAVKAKWNAVFPNSTVEPKVLLEVQYY